METVAAAPDVDTTQWKKDTTTPTIGYSGLNVTNSFQVQRVGAAQLVAEKYGAKLIVTNANNDQNKEISDIQDLLAQHVDALVISPITGDALKGVLKQATAAKVPVIIEGQDIGDNPDVVTQVFYSNITFGEVGGTGLCTALSGNGDVVMLRGIAGNSAEKDRYDAAKSAMQACGLNVVGEAYGNWSFSGGLQAAQTLVQTHPKIDGVWSSGSEMTRAAIQVFQQANRPLVPMTGEHENGFLQLWQDVKLNGIAPIFPTWQTPEAIKLALKILRGEPVKKRYDIQMPPITNESLSQFVNRDLPKDWWSDGYVKDGKVTNYLTPEEVNKVFAGS